MLGFRPSLGYIILAWAMVLGSCTVFENRDGCPNYLVVDLREVDKTIKEWQMWLFDEDGALLLKDTIHRRFYQEPYMISVPRADNVKCLMWGNMRNATRIAEEYSYRTYFEKLPDVWADSLYFFADTFSTKRENSYVKVTPGKEFATVDIYIKGWVGNDYEAEVAIICASSGFYVTKDFLGGETVTKASVQELGDCYTHFRSRILRQPDTENVLLKLYIRDLNPDGSHGEIKVDTEVPLGEYLFENGYDMNDISMEDIEIEIDYSYNRFMVKVADWEAVYKILEEI